MYTYPLNTLFYTNRPLNHLFVVIKIIFNFNIFHPSFLKNEPVQNRSAPQIIKHLYLYVGLKFLWNPKYYLNYGKKQHEYHYGEALCFIIICAFGCSWYDKVSYSKLCMQDSVCMSTTEEKIGSTQVHFSSTSWALLFLLTFICIQTGITLSNISLSILLREFNYYC